MELENPHCCRNCGRRAQWKALALASLLGWWGLPWGLIYMPVQLFKNLRDIARGPASIAPSEALQDVIRADLVQRYLDAEAAAQNGASPVPPVAVAPSDYSGAQAPLRPPIPNVPPVAPTGSLFKKAKPSD